MVQNFSQGPAFAAIFLFLKVKNGKSKDLKEILGDISSLGNSLRFKNAPEYANIVMGFGHDIWHELLDVEPPEKLNVFQEIIGKKHTAPSTPVDLLFHIRAPRQDLAFDAAKKLMDKIGEFVDIVDEISGFQPNDRRDILGFVDGTENPEIDDVDDTVVYEGQNVQGSYITIQKYIHDLDAWESLSTKDQEDAIGRTKLEDLEYPDDVKPADAHIELNVIYDENGEQLEIYRANMTFGSLTEKEFGTLFIGYSKDPDITYQMLKNMFLGVPPATHDRILDFSTALTGMNFFAPTADCLESILE